MKVLCECNSFDCSLKVDLSEEENIKAHENGKVIIVDGCKNGPEPTDTFVEQKNGFAFYKEKDE